MFSLHVEDVVLHLKGELVGAAIRTAAAIGEALDTALLIAVKDLVASLARNTELTAQINHGLACETASHKLKLLIHHRTRIMKGRPFQVGY
jgi:hypothetical protein